MYTAYNRNLESARSAIDCGRRLSWDNAHCARQQLVIDIIVEGPM